MEPEFSSVLRDENKIKHGTREGVTVGGADLAKKCKPGRWGLRRRGAESVAVLVVHTRDRPGNVAAFGGGRKTKATQRQGPLAKATAIVISTTFTREAPFKLSHHFERFPRKSAKRRMCTVQYDTVDRFRKRKKSILYVGYGRARTN